MKCPKCGFVSYPGLTQCKRCGHRFQSKLVSGKPSDPLGLFSEESPAKPVSPSPEPAPTPEPPIVEATPVDEIPIGTSREVGVSAPPHEPPRRSETDSAAWREELSQRVENFRRRRARIRGSSGSSANLELDFDASSAEDPGLAAQTAPEPHVSHGPGVDAELGGSTDARAWHPGGDALEGAEIGGQEVPPEPFESESGGVQLAAGVEHRPAEMVFDSPRQREEPEAAPTRLDLHLAPLSRRFWGGIIDTLVLVVAAGVFALIFWRAGGRMSPHALSLIAAGFIVVFLVFAYFGVFTALTSTTPGLLWMGIEVQSFRGGAPTPRQAVWRAFGYLVSTSALMLGFIWALVDSDGLTWHDRMSDTFLTPSDSGM